MRNIIRSVAVAASLSLLCISGASADVIIGKPATPPNASLIQPAQYYGGGYGGGYQRHCYRQCVSRDYYGHCVDWRRVCD